MKHYPFLALLVVALAVPVLAADPLTHVVQKGETLYSIARSYGQTVDAIIGANNIKDPSRISSGLRLVIPGRDAPETVRPPLAAYTVQKGDTLYGISRRFGISAESIQKANSLSTTTILPGQILSIPGKPGSELASGTTAPASATPPAHGVSSSGTVVAGQAPGSGTQNKAGSGTVPPKTTADASPAAAATAGVPATPVAVKAPAWPLAGTVSYLQGKLKGAAIQGQPGATLVAVRAGTVISAGPFRGFGKVAFVQASDGLVYVYGGAESLGVRVGDSVRRGGAVGVLDPQDEGLAYFFVFKGQDAIDPATAPRN